MFNINRVYLVGRLGADAELKTFQNGGSVVNFRMVTSESWKDRNTGEKKERSEWHNVAVFAKWLIDDASKFRKGDMVSIEGKNQTRKWQDRDGNDRYTTECVLTGIEHSAFKIAPRDRGQGSGGGGRQDSGGYDDRNYGGGSGSSGAAASTDQRYGGGHSSGSGGGGTGWSEDLDDDIPFVTCDPGLEAKRWRQW